MPSLRNHNNTQRLAVSSFKNQFFSWENKVTYATKQHIHLQNYSTAQHKLRTSNTVQVSSKSTIPFCCEYNRKAVDTIYKYTAALRSMGMGSLSFKLYHNGLISTWRKCHVWNKWRTCKRMTGWHKYRGVMILKHVAVFASHSWRQTASRYGGQLRIYWISSRGQSTTGAPPELGLGEGLLTPYRKKKACYVMLHRATELGFLWTR
jgi:hypothetical protein